MFNRFDFEDALMQLAQAETDVNLINEMIMNEGVQDTDRIANALLGIEAMTQLRFDKVMIMFEEGIKEGKIK